MRKPVILIALALSAAFAGSAQSAAPQDDADTIIQRSVAVDAADSKAAPSYDYFERDQQPGGGTRTYEERMILGSRYEKLVSINGEPLSPASQAEQQDKLEAAIAKRRSESAQQRKERIARYEKDRKRDQMMMEQLTKSMNFALVGEQKLNGYDVYVLKATPRADYRPPNMESQALRGMQGKLWIDKQTFQWVKVEAQVIRPVSIEGFLAEVEPGTRFELEKMPVGDGVWLPKHFAMQSRARVLFLFTRKSQDNETYYGYHKPTPTQASIGER
ncbi:MAG: hypothetical protein WBW53_11600 [Terriglobales bacterium]